MSVSTDLVAVDVLKAEEVFTPGGVEKLLLDVETKARALNTALDSSTEEGRAEIKSLAYKVARSKTALDELGKDFVAELKRTTAGIDADRRTIRDRLDALRDEVRKPVDEWEKAEQERVDTLVAALDALKALEQFPAGADPTIAEIDARLGALEIARARDWQEFSERAGQLVDRIGPALNTLRSATERRETERAELDRLRKAEAERIAAAEAAMAAREQRAREEKIAAEAAAVAKQEADARAEAERTRVEQERADAIRRAEAAEAAAAEAARQAEAQKKAAAAQALRDQDAAVEAERQRVATAKAAEDAAAAARARDKSHKATINKAALADLMTVAGLTEAQGKAVVTAIATGKISSVKINY